MYSQCETRMKIFQLNFETWEAELWPILVAFVLFGVFGLTINLVSFIYFKQQPGLGNRFQTVLNAVDFVICSYYICVAVIGFLSRSNLTTSSLDIIGKEFYTIMILISGLVTVYLSVIRAILSTEPFYDIKKRVIYTSFLGISVLFLGIAITDAVLIEIPASQLIPNVESSVSRIGEIPDPPLPGPTLEPPDPARPTLEPPDPARPSLEPPDPARPTLKPPDPARPTLEPHDPARPTLEPPDPARPTLKPPDPPTTATPAKNCTADELSLLFLTRFQLPAVLLEAIPSALLMLILTVSSLLTWGALSKPNNHLSNHSHAATTTLLISTVYVLCIGSIVTARSFIRLNTSNYTNQVTYEDHLGQLGKVSIVKLANSVLNPLIFVTRSRNLRSWIAGLFKRERVSKSTTTTISVEMDNM
eukprot:sb/3465078/